MKQISTVLVGVVILLNAPGCSNEKVRAAGPPPPPVVEVAPVVQQDVPIQGEWVGTLEGYVNAQIQPQVSGYLIHQDYHEGAFVKKGQLLFEIDPRPFQAVLDQAKGQLAQAEAKMANADINVKRDVPEAEAHAIPQSQPAVAPSPRLPWPPDNRHNRPQYSAPVTSGSSTSTRRAPRPDSR
jgi:multidrug efflux pump subunit AcrA (membrane-fusion protein)